MKYFLISEDADTCTGLRLAGVFFMLATTKEVASKALDTAVNDPETGLLMITRKIREFCPDKVSKINASGRPCLVEIPDSGTTDFSEGGAGDYIRETVGINI